MRRFLDFSRPGTIGALAPSTALSPNRVRPLLRAARDAKRATDGIGCALSAGVTGENSPHHTNQPRKMKTDRVLVKYFFARACARLQNGEGAEETVFEQIWVQREKRFSCSGVITVPGFAAMRRSRSSRRWMRWRIATTECPLRSASS
jgi:hypothetical protein